VVVLAVVVMIKALGGALVAGCCVFVSSLATAWRGSGSGGGSRQNPSGG